MNCLNLFLDHWEKKTKNSGMTKLHKRSQIKKLIVMRDRGDGIKEIGLELGITGARVSQLYRSYQRFEKRHTR